MNDYIVNKKYRLLELHPEDSFNNIRLEGKVFTYSGNGYWDGGGYYFLLKDSYPKMELVEEVQNDLPLGLEPDDLWSEKSKKNSTQEAERKQIVEEDEDILPMPAPRTFKKHYRFKNREYIRR